MHLGYAAAYRVCSCIKGMELHLEYAALTCDVEGALTCLHTSYILYIQLHMGYAAV